jgi:hypothetical protein
MRPIAAGTLLLAALALGWGTDAPAAKRTVCTITVNSSDEKEIFRQRLPAGAYEFVELVERGRPDWLASACRKGVRCDLLVISGHFDGRTDFYSDQVAASEFLPVAEMERASCSDSCPGLFSQLKEVYLFGCNTLSADALNRMSPEVERSLIRGGLSPLDAGRLSRTLDQRHAESSRDRMRRIFMNVPVLYGFSSVAPLGPTAASLLARWLQPSSLSEVGNGRPSQRLLGLFAEESMIAVSGLSATDPRAIHRNEACRFVDDRLAPEAKLAFVHELLRRDMAEVRMFLDRIEGLLASLSESARQSPAFAQALGEIASDGAVRDRYLRFAEDADQPAVRGRMIRLAGALGWLSPAEERAELVRMMADLLARDSIRAAEVDLACALNADHALDVERHRLAPLPSESAEVTHAAVLACLGSTEGRARVLQALISRDDAEVLIADVYFRHRPITDPEELRMVAHAITRMRAPGGQVRALAVLSRHRLSDRQSLDALAQFFPAAASVDVQRAIAAVFIRSDFRLLPGPETARMLSRSRLKSTSGDDIIDILIRRLGAS